MIEGRTMKTELTRRGKRVGLAMKRRWMSKAMAFDSMLAKILPKTMTKRASKMVLTEATQMMKTMKDTLTASRTEVVLLVEKSKPTKGMDNMI